MKGGIAAAAILFILWSVVLMTVTSPPEKLWPLVLWTVLVAAFGAFIGYAVGKGIE
jgi:hypothetical protein